MFQGLGDSRFFWQGFLEGNELQADIFPLFPTRCRRARKREDINALNGLAFIVGANPDGLLVVRQPKWKRTAGATAVQDVHTPGMGLEKAAFEPFAPRADAENEVAGPVQTFGTGGDVVKLGPGVRRGLGEKDDPEAYPLFFQYQCLYLSGNPPPGRAEGSRSGFLLVVGEHPEIVFEMGLRLDESRERCVR